MNNTFYICLYHFGKLISTASHQKKTKLRNYFTVVHPGMPIIHSWRTVKPEIEFTEHCPEAVKHSVNQLFQQAFNS